MQRLEISFDTLRQVSQKSRKNAFVGEFEDFLRKKLEEAGFDMQKEILTKYDLKKKKMIYIQKTQEEALGYKETDSGIIYRA